VLYYNSSCLRMESWHVVSSSWGCVVIEDVTIISFHQSSWSTCCGNECRSLPPELSKRLLLCALPVPEPSRDWHRPHWTKSANRNDPANTLWYATDSPPCQPSNRSCLLLPTRLPPSQTAFVASKGLASCIQTPNTWFAGVYPFHPRGLSNQSLPHRHKQCQWPKPFSAAAHHLDSIPWLAEHTYRDDRMVPKHIRTLFSSHDDTWERPACWNCRPMQMCSCTDCGTDRYRMQRKPPAWSNSELAKSQCLLQSRGLVEPACIPPDFVGWTCSLRTWQRSKRWDRTCQRHGSPIGWSSRRNVRVHIRDCHTQWSSNPWEKPQRNELRANTHRIQRRGARWSRDATFPVFSIVLTSIRTWSSVGKIKIERRPAKWLPTFPYESKPRSIGSSIVPQKHGCIVVGKKYIRGTHEGKMAIGTCRTTWMRVTIFDSLPRALQSASASSSTHMQDRKETKPKVEELIRAARSSVWRPAVMMVRVVLFLLSWLRKCPPPAVDSDRLIMSPVSARPRVAATV